MKLLIAGAESPTGHELVRLLQQQGVGHESIPTRLLDGDRSSLEQFVAGQRADQLINLLRYEPASQRMLAAAEQDEATCARVQRTYATLLASIGDQFDLPLIHLSSCYVFDGEKRLGYNEQDEVNPAGVYGRTTLQGELAVQQLEKHLIIRTGWHFGRRQHDVIKSWIDCCKDSGGKLQVLQRRFSPTPNEDVARVILAVCRQVDCDASVWGIYHYCGLETKKEIEFVQQVLKYASQHDGQVYQFLDNFTMSETPTDPPEVKNSTLSSKKIFDTFGIKQRSWHGSLKAALKTIYRESTGNDADQQSEPLAGSPGSISSGGLH